MDVAVAVKTEVVFIAAQNHSWHGISARSSGTGTCSTAVIERRRRLLILLQIRDGIPRATVKLSDGHAFIKGDASLGLGIAVEGGVGLAFAQRRVAVTTDLRLLFLLLLLVQRTSAGSCGLMSRYQKSRCIAPAKARVRVVRWGSDTRCHGCGVALLRFAAEAYE